MNLITSLSTRNIVVSQMPQMPQMLLTGMWGIGEDTTGTMDNVVESRTQDTSFGELIPIPETQ